MDYIQARDAIYGQFTTAWNNGADIAGNLPYIPEIFYRGIGKAKPADASRFWCRISTQVVQEPQSAFGQNVGSQGNRRYTTDGLIFVQLFGPKVPGSMDVLAALAVLARNTFRRSSATGLVLRNSRIDDTVSPEKEYNRFNVVAEYEHDETQ